MDFIIYIFHGFRMNHMTHFEKYVFFNNFIPPCIIHVIEASNVNESSMKETLY